MWGISKDGEAIYNLDTVSNLYAVSSGGYKSVAVRCNFAGGNKDLTLANYDSYEQAKMAIKYVYDSLYMNANIVQMPDESKLNLIGRKYESKTRSQNGKKTVRRGGS